MGEGRVVYRVLVGRPEGKRPLGRPRCRRDDNIKLDLRKIGIDGANWIQLVQDRVQWWAFVSTVMNLRIP
jgi:transposase